MTDTMRRALEPLAAAARKQAAHLRYKARDATSELARDLILKAHKWEQLCAEADEALAAADRISAAKVEGCEQDAIYAAYLGICVLKTVCRHAGLTLGEDRARELLVEMDTAFPFIGERVGLSDLRTAPPPASEGG